MRRGYHQYTPEQEAFLRENISKCDSYEDLANLISDFCGSPFTVQSVKEKCKRIGIRLGKNAGRFKPKGRPRSLPIGTIRSSKNAMYIKISDIGTGISGYEPPDWVPLQKYLYEKAFGKINEKEQVIFLDGNKDNFSLSNLCPVDMKIKAYLARNKMYSSDSHITKTAILTAKLILMLKGKEKHENGKE